MKKIILTFALFCVSFILLAQDKGAFTRKTDFYYILDTSYRVNPSFTQAGTPCKVSLERYLSSGDYDMNMQKVGKWFVTGRAYSMTRIDSAGNFQVNNRYVENGDTIRYQESEYRPMAWYDMNNIVKIPYENSVLYTNHCDFTFVVRFSPHIYRWDLEDETNYTSSVLKNANIITYTEADRRIEGISVFPRPEWEEYFTPDDAVIYYILNYNNVPARTDTLVKYSLKNSDRVYSVPIPKPQHSDDNIALNSLAYGYIYDLQSYRGEQPIHRLSNGVVLFQYGISTVMSYNENTGEFKEFVLDSTRKNQEKFCFRPLYKNTSPYITPVIFVDSFRGNQYFYNLDRAEYDSYHNGVGAYYTYENGHWIADTIRLTEEDSIYLHSINGYRRDIFQWSDDEVIMTFNTIWDILQHQNEWTEPQLVKNWFDVRRFYIIYNIKTKKYKKFILPEELFNKYKNTLSWFPLQLATDWCKIVDNIKTIDGKKWFHIQEPYLKDKSILDTFIVDTVVYTYARNVTETGGYYIIYDPEKDKTSIEEVPNISVPIKALIHPNPSSDIVNFSVELQEYGNLKITLSDLQGRELLILYDAFMDVGTFTHQFSMKGLPQGVYYLKIQQNGNSKTEKVIKN